MLTARRLTVYTQHRSRLTPRQRRRAVHKANALEPTARAVALAAIAALVAGCSAAGRTSENRSTARVGSPAVRLVANRPVAPMAPTTTTTTTAPPVTTRPRPKGPQPTRPAVKGNDFWARLAACESPKGKSGYYTGFFQMSPSNAAHYGITPSSSYEDQRAAAQDLAAHSDPHHQWPVCWARAGG